jgi:hypothetical protein
MTSPHYCQLKNPKIFDLSKTNLLGFLGEGSIGMGLKLVGIFGTLIVKAGFRPLGSAG